MTQLGPLAGTHIGAVIRTRRKEIKMSVKELAERCQVDPFTVYRWEQGRSNPQQKLLPEIGKALNLAISREVVVLPRIQ